MKPKTYISLLFIVLTACLTILAINNVKAYKSVSAQNDGLKWQINGLSLQINNNKTEIKQDKAQITSLSAEISALQAQLEQKQDKSDRSGERGTRRIMEVTAYWEGSCGKAPDDPEYGITASGEYVQEWYTVAAGPELPFGAQIYIPYFAEMPNNGVFTVADRGGSIKDGCIDVYMKDYASCMEFGRQWLEVWLVE
jgi:3D (Asp-Asp-Asp) domain-containing protein